MNILVLDVGTSSMRGTLFNENAAVLFQKQIKYSPTFRENGTVVQPPQDWLRAVKTLCRSTAEVNNVDAIALTAQRSSVIPADTDGNPLTDAIMWQDTRSSVVCDALMAHEDSVRAICGTGINTVYSGGKMAWLRQNMPDIYDKTVHLFVIPDYLIYQMTGQHVTDYTYGSRSMLMDLRTREWSAELLSLFGVEEKKLGRLIPPGSVAGMITAAFAAETGLTAGIPVVSCGGDQQCGAAGQGVYTQGSISVNLGTGAYLIAPVRDVPDVLCRGTLCNVSAVSGEYILEASVLTCGAAIDWFLRELGGGEGVSLIGTALEKSPPGSGGVTMLPYFQGRAAPDWNSTVRASFHGLSLSTTREDMLRAMIESICIEVSRSLRALDVGADMVSLGGGLSQASALCQLMADVTGLPVVSGDDRNATSRGAWMSAALCFGVVRDWDEAWQLIRPRRVQKFFPDTAITELYSNIAENIEAHYWAACETDRRKADAERTETESI